MGVHGNYNYMVSLVIKCRAKGRTSTDVTGLRYNNNAFYQNDTKYNITTRQMLTFLV